MPFLTTSLKEILGFPESPKNSPSTTPLLKLGCTLLCLFKFSLSLLELKVSWDMTPELIIPDPLVTSFCNLSFPIFVLKASVKKFLVPQIVRFNTSPSRSCIGFIGAGWFGPAASFALEGLLIHFLVESTVKNLSGPRARSSSIEFGTIYVVSILLNGLMHTLSLCTVWTLTAPLPLWMLFGFRYEWLLSS